MKSRRDRVFNVFIWLFYILIGATFSHMSVWFMLRGIDLSDMAGVFFLIMFLAFTMVYMNHSEKYK